jgi:hypothetical protein
VVGRALQELLRICKRRPNAFQNVVTAYGKWAVGR